MKLPKFTNLYVVSALTTIGGLIQGFDVSSMSAILGTDQYKTYFNNPESVLQGGITASMAGGSLLGSVFASYTGDKFGRRDSLFIACIVWVVGCILMAAVQNVAMLIVSRIVNGFSVGILTSQGPILIAEISLPGVRGRLLSLQQWMITWGILIMYFVTYGTSFLSGNISFRLPWALQVVPSIVLMVCIPMMPRSPRWLAGKDRWQEAIDVLANLHAKGDRQDPLVLAEVQEIRHKLSLEAEYGSQSWMELFNSRNFIRVHCALFTHIWAQYAGINAMMYYIVYIFEMAGLTGNQNLLSASIQYIINVVMTVPALLFMDKLPRRQVLMVGSFLMAVWLFTEAALMARYGHHVPQGLNGSSSVTWVVENDKASKAIIACSYLFVATYAPTWGPVGWIYPPEIIPFYIRSKAVSLSTVLNWAMNFSLTFFTPPAFENIQWKTYCIFGTLCLVSLIHVFLLFQETCGKTLEEMDEVFDNESVWAFKVEYKPSRITAEAAEVAQKQAKGVQAIEEESHHDGKDGGLVTSHQETRDSKV